MTRLTVDFASSAAELPDELFAGPTVRPERTRTRLLELERDVRFEALYICVGSGSQIAVALPCYTTQVARWPNPEYDAASIFGQNLAPSDCRLLGGRADLCSGALATASVDANVAATAVGHAIEIAGKAPAGGSNRLALLYIDGMLLEAARHRGNAIAALGARSTMTTIGTDLDSYIDALGARRSRGRQEVRRDIRRIVDAGLAAKAVPWETVIDDAAPLIAARYERYGRHDHPLLAAYRLRSWSSNGELSHVALEVRDEGQLLGATFGWAYRGVLYLYEIGLASNIGDRRGLVYLELTFYAPLRYAWSNGLTAIDLGLGAVEVKRLRGAETTSVFGVLR